MAIPTHGPSCQTWVYETACRYCGQDIHIMQCTCGSAVLFEAMGRPWPLHDCQSESKGVGGSGLSGWQAVDVLKRRGIPVDDAVMKKIFPEEISAPTKAVASSPEADTKRISPDAGWSKDLLAVLRELNRPTKNTSYIEGLPDLGKKLLGLDPDIQHYWQVTLVRNDVRPNESYTALVPAHLILPLKEEKDVMVAAKIDAHVLSTRAYWVVSDIRIL